MSRFNTTFEIHLHGTVPLREEVMFDQLQDALRPIWVYAGARSLTECADSFYEEEPGIRFDANDHVLQICWTIKGEDDFRQAVLGSGSGAKPNFSRAFALRRRYSTAFSREPSL
jgi:hypothetical protein